MLRARRARDKDSHFSAPTHGARLGFDNLHELVLRWYAQNRRDLPWRHTRDPYRILVSEVMLQQTQVDRVIPKYEQFLERFPTLNDLAAASLGDVLRVWSPLGYNRRARYLHLAARAAHARFGGSMPSSPIDLRSLPGIGRYTAAALACFAYEQQLPVVDTNIRRVLGRILLGQRDGLREAAAWKLAHEALPASHAYNWNQALMDLGAIICAAENPQCPECPAIEACLWRSSAISSGLSLRSVREPRTEYQAPDPGASRRRWRGRIIDALRAAQPDEFVSWPTIVASLPAGHESDGVNLNDLLTSLVNDGLAEREDADDLVRVRLPR